MSDIKAILADVEDLLKQTASTTGERAIELRENALVKLKQAKEKAAEAQAVVIKNSKKAAHATEEYVREHPWHAVGVVAGVSILIGLLINRK